MFFNYFIIKLPIFFIDIYYRMNKECICDCGECDSKPSCQNNIQNVCDPCADNLSESCDSVHCSEDGCSTESNSSEPSEHCEQNEKKYRFVKNGKIFLNICPPKTLYLDVNYVSLYEQLYKAILDNCLELKLKCVLSGTSTEYDSFYTQIITIFNLPLYPTDGFRLVVTEPDGTVIIDTIKTTSNTFSNWKTKTINENHNSRIAILDAQSLEGGVGYEFKHSSTMDLYQYYVAIRAGLRYKNYGTFRLSINLCTLLIG
jgi:hypothetical protein